MFKLLNVFVPPSTNCRSPNGCSNLAGTYPSYPVASLDITHKPVEHPSTIIWFTWFAFNFPFKPWLTLEGEQQFKFWHLSGDFPLNHKKQTCKMFNNNHDTNPKTVSALQTQIGHSVCLPPPSHCPRPGSQLITGLGSAQPTSTSSS